MGSSMLDPYEGEMARARLCVILLACGTIIVPMQLTTSQAGLPQ
jgi:hypothetical protein